MTPVAREDHTNVRPAPGVAARATCTVVAAMALEPSVVTVTGPDRAALLTDLTLRFGHIELVSEREIVLPGGGRRHGLTVRHRPFTSELGGVVAPRAAAPAAEPPAAVAAPPAPAPAAPPEPPPAAPGAPGAA